MAYDYDSYRERTVDVKFCIVFLCALFAPALLLGLSKLIGG